MSFYQHVAIPVVPKCRDSKINVELFSKPFLRLEAMNSYGVLTFHVLRK